MTQDISAPWMPTRSFARAHGEHFADVFVRFVAFLEIALEISRDGVPADGGSLEASWSSF
jgi:hypothetical protein